MKPRGLLAIIVLALAICEAHTSRVISQPVLAQPTSGDFAALRKPVTLSYSTKQCNLARSGGRRVVPKRRNISQVHFHLTEEVMPSDINNTTTTVTTERPGQSRRDRARALNLTYSQKQSLVVANMKMLEQLPQSED